MRLDGKEYIHYRAPRIDVAIIRGTTADEDGNVSFERECFFSDALNQVSSASKQAFHLKQHHPLVLKIRGTQLTVHCNFAFPKEKALQAIAAHNNGGLVIVQVERLAAPNSLPTRAVHLPAALVDKVSEITFFPHTPALLA